MRLQSLIFCILCFSSISLVLAFTQLDSYTPTNLLHHARIGASAAWHYLCSISSLEATRPITALRKRLQEPGYHQCVLSKKPAANVLGANGTAAATWGIGTQTTTTITRSVPSVSATLNTAYNSSSSSLHSSTSTSRTTSSQQQSSTTRSTTSSDPPTTTSDPPPTTPNPPPPPAITSDPPPPPPPPTTTSSAAPSPSSIWNVVETFSGQNFFSGFTFWDQNVDGGDPTHGTVDYVGYQDALNLGLIGINQQNHAVLAVSTAAVGSTSSRPSIRISTTRTFTGGLLVADIIHMPTGCGTWPSFWTCGPNWPQGGEIDIIEGIHASTINTASVHTNPGCYMPADYGASGTLLSQPPEGLDCSAAETNDAGCGLTASGANTYGAGFNSAGGGVYAMQWDETGIYTFFFPRSSVPSDLTSGYPNPSSWGEPAGAWPASTCNPYQYFYNHVAIFDTTLCGDWAGATWNSQVMGQGGGTCAQITGVGDCESYVRAQGGAFASAYWEIASVTLYQKAGQGA